jgi:hypothetical protein
VTGGEYPEATLEDYQNSIAKVIRRLRASVEVRMDIVGMAELRVQTRHPTRQFIDRLLQIAQWWWVEQFDEGYDSAEQGEALLGPQLVSIVLKA